jgi:CHRD domain
MRLRLGVLAALAAVMAGLTLAAVAVADDAGRPFTTTLTGAAEVPGPGDPNATGTSSLRLNPGQGEVCHETSWADVDGTVFAGHIHVGTANEAGPVVVTLFTGSFAGTDGASACLQADRELIKAIIQKPENYYVNVHSTVFPAGAVRGQLGG